VGGATGFAVVILALVVVAIFAALAGFSVNKATRRGGKTYFKVRAAGVVLEFGSEIDGSSTQGAEAPTPPTANEHRSGGVVQKEQLKIETKPPPTELPPGRRDRWRWPRKRAPDGGAT